ncbi:MAG: hypothetical protein JSS61_07520 [Verrucomicrobia bacterium]|nr:hypothetical protein [Verrucomicrobiota bacterium]
MAFLERKVLATAKRKLDKYENYRAKLLSHAIALHNSRCERQFGLDGREAQSLETLYRDKSNLRNELLQHLKLDANCTLSTLELVGLKIEIEKSQARKEKKFTKVLGENCYDVLFKAATKQQIGDVPGLINRVKAESTKRLTIHSSSLVMSLGLGCITVLSILLKFGRVVPLVSLICSGLSLAIGAGRIGLETWKMQEIFEGPVGKYDRHFIIAGMVFGVLSLAATIGITFFLSGPLLPAFVAILATIVAFGFSYYSLHLVKKKEERYQAWLASNK